MPKRDSENAAGQSEGVLDNSDEVTGNRSGLDDQLQAHIGRQLRMFYEGVTKEPIPDRFLKLLDELESAAPRGVDGPGEGRDGG